MASGYRLSDVFIEDLERRHNGRVFYVLCGCGVAVAAAWWYSGLRSAMGALLIAVAAFLLIRHELAKQLAWNQAVARSVHCDLTPSCLVIASELERREISLKGLAGVDHGPPDDEIFLRFSDPRRGTRLAGFERADELAARLRTHIAGDSHAD